MTWTPHHLLALRLSYQHSGGRQRHINIRLKLKACEGHWVSAQSGWTAAFGGGRKESRASPVRADPSLAQEVKSQQQCVCGVGWGVKTSVLVR